MSWVDDPRDEQDETARALRAALAEARVRTGDEIARRRVWGRIAQPELFEAPPRRWPLLAMVPTLVLAAVVALFLVRPIGSTSDGAAGSEPKLASVPRPSSPSTGNEPAAPIAELDETALLTAPSRVSTGSGERRRVRLRNGARLTVAPASVLTLDAGERPRVQSGEVFLEVPKQPPNHRFTVAAGGYVIVVVGTKFKVSVEGERVGVAVEEGLVEVWRGQERVAVPAGVSWASLVSPGPSASEAQGEPVNGPQYQAKVENGPLRAVGSPGRRSVGARSVATGASSRPTGGPQAAQRLAELAPVRLALTSPGAGPGAVATPGTRGAAAPTPAPAVAPRSIEAAPAPRAASDQFREAQAALAASEPDRALKILMSVAQGQGPAAENAAYEMGRVLRDQMLRPHDAVRAWARYRARFPRGVLAPEAHLSILETLVSVGDEEGALVEAESFLARYPSSERRAEVARVVERLRRVETPARSSQTVGRP